MKSTLLVAAAAALLAALGPAVPAEPPRQILWEDLVPKAPQPDPALTKLTRDQLADLAEIASLRERIARGDKLNTADQADVEGLPRKLQQAGIDVDALLAKRKELMAQRQAQKTAVNPALTGQLIRIPGYLLPLEYSGKQVSEFLLVPWVGACIHTPPPPPNQIVHVKPLKPVEYSGMFEPVWVTGALGTSSSKRSLFMLDGSADIDVGYTVQAAQVEPYKQ
jgi:hypothetical protein